MTTSTAGTARHEPAPGHRPDRAAAAGRRAAAAGRRAPPASGGGTEHRLVPGAGGAGDDAAAGRRAARRRRRAGRGLPDRGLAGALRPRAGGRPAVGADASAGLETGRAAGRARVLTYV